MTGNSTGAVLAPIAVVVNRPKLSFAHRALAIAGVLEASNRIAEVGEGDDALDVRSLMRLKTQRHDEERMIVTDKFVVVGGLLADTDCESPLESCDGEGHIYRRDGNELSEFYKAMGLDSDGEIPQDHPTVNAILADMVIHNLMAQDDALSRLRSSLSKTGRPLIRNAVEQRLRDLVINTGVEEVQASFELQEPDLDWSELFKVSYNDAFHLARKLGKIGSPGCVPLDIYDHGGVHYKVDPRVKTILNLV